MNRTIKCKQCGAQTSNKVFCSIACYHQHKRENVYPGQYLDGHEGMKGEDKPRDNCPYQICTRQPPPGGIEVTETFTKEQIRESVTRFYREHNRLPDAGDLIAELTGLKFSDGQVLRTASGSFAVYQNRLGTIYANCRPLTPEEAGPNFVTLEDYNRLKADFDRVVKGFEIYGGLRAAREVLDAIPDEYR